MDEKQAFTWTRRNLEDISLKAILRTGDVMLEKNQQDTTMCT